MVRAIIIAAVLCLAAVVLAAEQEDGVGIQWCSKTTYCRDGLHCCTATTCCPNNLYCCGAGRLCCAFSNSPETDQIPAIFSNKQ